MNQKEKQNKKSQIKLGFTLIEVLVAVFLFAILSLSVYNMFILASQIIADTKLRMMAVYIANEEMERVKSLNYEKIGTENGIPKGILLDNKTIEQGGYPFDIKTEVRFLDDEEDGIFPEDDDPADYKLVRIAINWPGHFSKREVVSLYSAYPSTLTNQEDGGILRIKTLNSEGLSVASSSIEIQNFDADNPVSISTTTNISGEAFFSGVPFYEKGYRIKVDRLGYETVETLPPYPETNFNPVDKDVMVIDHEETIKTFQIDELSNFSLFFANEKGELIPNLQVSLEGGRIIGYTLSDEIPGGEPKPIYNFKANELTSDLNGELKISNTNPGLYFINLDDSDYELIKVLQGENERNNFMVLPPGKEENVNVLVVLRSLDSLLIKILDSATKEPISEVNVTVTKEEFNTSSLTNSFGQVFFFGNEFVPEEYQIEINHPNYHQYNETITLGGLTKKEIYLVSK